MSNFLLVADPASTWDTVGRAVLEAGAKLSATIRRVVDANSGAHLNWMLFCATDAAVRSLIVFFVLLPFQHD